MIIGGSPIPTSGNSQDESPSEGSEGTLLMRVGSITLEITNSAGKHYTINPLQTRTLSRKPGRNFITRWRYHPIKHGGVLILCNTPIQNTLIKTIAEFLLNKNKLYVTTGKTLRHLYCSLFCRDSVLHPRDNLRYRDSPKKTWLSKTVILYYSFPI